MNHWVLDSLGENLTEALKQADRAQVYFELYRQRFQEDADLIRRTAEALELAVLDMLHEGAEGDEKKTDALRSLAAKAFRLFRILPPLSNPVEDAVLKLRSCSMAVIGDRGADAARLLGEYDWSILPISSEDWKERTWCTIIDIWLRLIRKRGWEDRDLVLERISDLRAAQQTYEERYLDNQAKHQVKGEALELIGLYHLAKSAEILAHYITDGVVEGNYQVQSLLDTHFDRLFLACQESQMLDLEPLARLLYGCASQMVGNSIWTVTRAVNSRVSEFVRSLVDKGRGDKALFDVLPPQRRTLAEKGLLGSSRRAVVVSLPTSSGKTLIAQFRILQALNQFDHEKGWVAYLAPTRTLVNQITRQVRRDFAPLDIIVEQVSPALEVDGIEANLLNDTNGFRVLVTTPEKLDLILRQGWEQRIGRPLTLVVVDEAHNIQDPVRGLKLELLLSTINNEYERAQFLLLTPFIENASDVARWLGGSSSDDVSLSVEWQPNDRVVGIVKPEKGGRLRGRSFDYELNFSTVHSNRSIAVEERLTLAKNKAIAVNFNEATSQATATALAAQYLKERGPVVVMHARPDWVWSLADKFKISDNRLTSTSTNIRLTQEFLKLEYGDNFPLVELLEYGVGVHHAGLSDDVRQMMEWLYESNELQVLAATTTIAQGVNFPITGVILASHQYPDRNRMTDMPATDFWNIAGRTGRVGQGKLGFVVLAAKDHSKASTLTEFVNLQTGILNSALIVMASKAKDLLNDLGETSYFHPEWSGFLQYLAHTYRQMGKPEDFINKIELILRGTYGFNSLRKKHANLAKELLDGIYTYAKYIQRPNQPLKLVDSTGFSLNSINRVFAEADKADIKEVSWNADRIFRKGDNTLQRMMGVLLAVPELRRQLIDVTGGDVPDGNKLSLIIKDWVNGAQVSEIADKYFKTPGIDINRAMTRCGQNLYGRLTQTASWGLGALLSITGSELPEEDYNQVRNLPSQVYYGVNDDSAITLRLLGVPRTAAKPLARSLGDLSSKSLPIIREQLKGMTEENWQLVMGKSEGTTYRKVWRILEGLD